MLLLTSSIVLLLVAILTDYQYSDILMQEKLRIAANWITLVAPCVPLRTDSIEKV
jgi:hypothetical protein